MAHCLTALELKGTICPYCDQRIQAYKRRLYCPQAHTLILMAQRPPQDSDVKIDDGRAFFHVPSFLASKTTSATIRGGDWAKAVYWNLIEPLANFRTDGSKRNGFYRITAKGLEFVHGRITVPKYAFIYNQTLHGFSDGEKFPRESTTIQEALGTKFNYSELMGGEPSTLIEKLRRTLDERKGPHRAPKGGL